jgi:hypothetical protein
MQHHATIHSPLFTIHCPPKERGFCVCCQVPVANAGWLCRACFLELEPEEEDAWTQQ